MREPPPEANEVLRRLYLEYGQDLLAVAATILGQTHGAWDVLHDVFIGLARNLGHLLPDTNYRAYLVRAAVNRATDHLRKVRVRNEEPPDAMETAPAPQAQPIELVSDSEEALRLWRAVCELPPEQRRVVSQHIYGQLTFSQIAQADGVSENTCQSRYRYALEKLRKSLLEVPQ
jgi:RNA polymerase sigma-70 factor (ECF subfamily)